MGLDYRAFDFFVQLPPITMLLQVLDSPACHISSVLYATTSAISNKTMMVPPQTLTLIAHLPAVSVVRAAAAAASAPVAEDKEPRRLTRPNQG